jgi:hypothetical protein
MVPVALVEAANNKSVDLEGATAQHALTVTLGAVLLVTRRFCSRAERFANAMPAA